MIGVDLDEVLGGFIPALCLWHNHVYETNLTAASFHSYRFCDVWGGTNEEATDKVHAFFETTFFTELEPIEGAKEALTAIHDSFDLVVITSRQHVIQDKTREWLEKHFSGIFKEVMFGNHYSKVHYCSPHHHELGPQTLNTHCFNFSLIMMILEGVA